MAQAIYFQPSDLRPTQGTTVQELIEKLSQFDKHLLVLLDQPDCYEVFNIDSVTQKTVSHRSDCSPFSFLPVGHLDGEEEAARAQQAVVIGEVY